MAQKGYSGAKGKLIRDKNRSRKSHVRLPLMVLYCYLQARLSRQAEIVIPIPVIFPLLCSSVLKISSYAARSLKNEGTFGSDYTVIPVQPIPYPWPNQDSETCGQVFFVKICVPLENSYHFPCPSIHTVPYGQTFLLGIIVPFTIHPISPAPALNHALRAGLLCWKKCTC
jgi:hypothetical protein